MSRDESPPEVLDSGRVAGGLAGESARAVRPA